MATKTGRKVTITYEGNKAWNGIHNDGLAHFEVWYGSKLLWHNSYQPLPELNWYALGLRDAQKWCDANGYDYS